jgi:transaldolase
MQPKSLLHEMTLKFPQTEFWNDSCEGASLARAISHGATGATSNPVIVLQAMQTDMPVWKEHVRSLLRRYPAADDAAIAWELIALAAGIGADLLHPVFEQTKGQRGRVSVQVNPNDYRAPGRMLDQARQLATIRENIAIKIPASAAGVNVIERLTGEGITTNATVCYTVPQAVAVAEAVERGLRRAERKGQDTSGMTPWVTIMVGRLEDHLKDQARESGRGLTDTIFRLGSVAVFKEAYRIFQERGYRAKLLAAAMRGHEHWSEFIGGDCVITIPPAVQEEFNASGVAVESRIQDQVNPGVIAYLAKTFPDFRKAYGIDPLPIGQFDLYGASQKTLAQFSRGYQELLAFVADVRVK